MRPWPRSIRRAVLVALDLVTGVEGPLLRELVIDYRRAHLPQRLKWLGHVSAPSFEAELVRMQRRGRIEAERRDDGALVYGLTRARYLPPAAMSTNTAGLIPSTLTVQSPVASTPAADRPGSPEHA